MNHAISRASLFLLGVLMLSPSLAQEKRINGTVTDDKGSPLSGATVSVKNTGAITRTDAKGSFSIPIPSNGKALVVSFVGMEQQEQSIGNRTTIDFTMTSVNATLTDVVVIGYGTARKSDLTGSVQRVGREELTRVAPTNVLSAMQGKVAGVNVTQNDGAPGAGVSVRIRGSNSFLGGTEPLYVIDGVPFTTSGNGGTPNSLRDDEKQTVNPLSFLNPSDIESIDVLKDASATAIYGSRGANGVVLITTRKGRTGKDKVDFSLTTGISEVTKKLDMLNAVDYATYQNTAYSNSNKYNGTSYTLPYPADSLPSQTNPDSNYYAPGPQDYAGKGTDVAGYYLSQGHLPDLFRKPVRGK